MSATMPLATISSCDLATVSGGAAGFDAFAAKERQRVAPQYKEIVCTGAGIKGGPQLANGLYKNATDGEQIAASGMLHDLCMKGRRLPSQAPASPF